MCGLIGYFQNQRNYFHEENIKKFNNLLSNLECRGPDNLDYFVDDKKKNYLGHTRLSILDLSENSNQTIYSLNKNLIMVFNGEIYNHQKLFDRIKNLNISKQIQISDTRILLEHISQFGIQETLNLTNGMYAIALYDISKNKLYLARDFWGKKPIYYYNDLNKIFFSSTISPILKSKILNNKINLSSLNEYFEQGFITGHQGSIIKGVKQLRPNSILEFDLSNEQLRLTKEVLIIEEKYPEKKFFELPKFEEKIINSVNLRLKSDVNAGLLLSSGIDSSVVASISSKINKNINTFTIGFKNLGINDDETSVASQISKSLGLKNQKLIFDNKSISNFVNNLEVAFDEPFADSSQIPSMIVFSEISKFAKVAITGDGGDEIFYGYNRYKYYNLWQKGLKYFKPILNLLKNEKIKSSIYRNLNFEKINQLEKFINIFCTNQQINYKNFTKLSFNDSIVNLDEGINASEEIINNLEDLRINDIKSYMAYDILTKIDRSSMFYSVEARSPLLDINIYNYLKNTTIDQNINLINNKILLKKVLKKYLPDHLINNSKKGFSIPLSSLLQDSIKNNYFELYNYVNNKKLVNYLNITNVEKYHNLFFLKKDLRYTALVWSFFVYFKWLIKYEQFIDQ